MVIQNGSVKQGDPYAPNMVLMAPNTAAVATAPPALRATTCGECLKKTPTPKLVKAELKPQSPMEMADMSAPSASPVAAPMEDPSSV